MVWGMGLNAAPEAVSIPYMKGIKGGGRMNPGVNSWI